MLKIFKNHIDVKSFFRRGVKQIEDPWGVLLITGYMGSGKTYFSVYAVNNLLPKLKIYTNIHSLKIPDREISYFDRMDEIIDNFESNCIFLIDEISKKYTKDSKQDKEFYSWLQQSRKVNRIVILILQEYLQTPTWIRSIAQTVYTTKKLPILNLFYTNKGYAELDPETLDWYVVAQERFIYKRNKYITKLYDTFEPVPVL